MITPLSKYTMITLQVVMIQIYFFQGWGMINGLYFKI